MTSLPHLQQNSATIIIRETLEEMQSAKEQDKVPREVTKASPAVEAEHQQQQ